MTTATTNPDRTPVASDVFTLCTKEKIDTWHVVMAHGKTGVVERVKCKACGSEHKYKSRNPLLMPKKATSSGTSAVRKVGQTQLSAATRAAASTATSKSLEEDWLAGLKKWGNKAVTDFSPQSSYQVGEVFTHSVFGKGVVQGRRENKVDVLFQTGMKTLPSKMMAN